MNFFDWLNKAVEGESPKQEMQSVNTESKDVVVAEVVKPKSKLYTAEDVHRDLTEMMLLFLTDIQQEIECKEVPAVIQNDAALLSELGFPNSKNTQIVNDIKKSIATHNKACEEKKSALAFMEEVWQKFGKETMVVRYDHFFEILEKYDMVCGSFDRYTGAIPQEAIDTLKRLSKMMKRKMFDKRYGISFDYSKKFDVTRNDGNISAITRFSRMPMLASDERVCKEICKVTRTTGFPIKNIFSGNITDTLFIAAPTADMKPLPITIGFPIAKKAGEDAVAAERRISPDSVRYDWQREYTSRRAIRKEEERLQAIIEQSDVPRYCKCDFIKTQPIPERKVYDPFICSLTRYGVLIHAKWGAEAEDATIKRYEQLRDAVIGKGGVR